MPIPFTWTGDSFQPANRHWSRKCDERFVVGETYTMEEIHARSSATHAHYFALRGFTASICSAITREARTPPRFRSAPFV